MKQKTNETVSSREQALAWWNNLTQTNRAVIIISNFRTVGLSELIGVNLTGREIEEIWRKEVGDLKLHKGEVVDESYPKEFQDAYSKPNQKVFKEFDEFLFKSYISKFSNEDKLKMLAKLSCEITTVDPILNELLNRISCYGGNK